MQQGPATPWGQAMVTISWMHLDSQRPASGKTWPIWLHRNVRVWASVLHCSIRSCLGFWLDSFPPLMHDSERLHAHEPLLAEVTQIIYVMIFNEKASTRGGVTTQEHMTQGPMRPSWLAAAEDLLGLCSPVTSPEFSARGLWKTWSPKGQWRGPLTFYWSQLLGYGYTGGEKTERHNYHLVNCVGYWISPWMSLLISVLFNPPGTQGFPRETAFPSQWKGKWALQAAQEHHTASNPSLKWVAWSCY